jgi:hypothetical protein
VLDPASALVERSGGLLCTFSRGDG